MKHFVIFLAVALFFSSWNSPRLKQWILTGAAQGTTYHIAYWANDSSVTQSQADSILNSLDSSLSLYKSYSVVNAFNSSPGGIRVDAHLKNVVRKGQEIFAATGGAFDITVWPLVNAWGFGARKTTEVPDSASIAGLMPCIGTGKLQWSGDFLQKKLPCVQLDVNGIAQGYSVDVLSTFIESKGITNYIVELGGEMRMKGDRQPGDSGWQIGIESPGGPFDRPVVKKMLALNNGAVTTSGTYYRFYESNGKRITHIIDPRTGGTIQNEIISVTVLAPDAMTADAYDNALMVLGIEQGLRLAEKVGIEAYFIYRTSKGRVADTATARFYSMMD